MTQATTVADARPRSSRRRRVLAGIALVLACLDDPPDDARRLDTPGRPQHEPVHEPRRERRHRPGRHGSDQQADQHPGRRRARHTGAARGSIAGCHQATGGCARGLRDREDRPTAPGRPPGPTAPGGPGRDGGLHPRPDRAALARRNGKPGYRRWLRDARRLPGRGRRLDRAAVDGTDPARYPAPRPDLARCP